MTAALGKKNLKDSVVGYFDLPARGSVTRSNVSPPGVQDHSNAFWWHSLLRVKDPRAVALGCSFASFPKVAHYQGFRLVPPRPI
jgi:hypothetical protein